MGTLVDIILEVKKNSFNSKERGVAAFFSEVLSKKYPGKYPSISHPRDLKAVPAHILARIAEHSISSDKKKANELHWDAAVADKSLIIADFEYVIPSESYLFLPPEFGPDLVIRAIPGHAQQGHVTFSNRKPNTTSTDVVNALINSKVRNRDAFEFGGFYDRSQSRIDGIVRMVEAFYQKVDEKLANGTLCYDDCIVDYLPETAFFGSGNKINILEYMRGFFFGANMDSFDVRSQGFEEYGIQAGGGDTVILNRAVLRKHGINLDHLSTVGSHKKHLSFLNHLPSHLRMDVLRGLGAIVEVDAQLDDIPDESLSWDLVKETLGVEKNANLLSGYVRHARGMGVSDDFARINAGFLPGTYTRTRNTTNLDFLSRVQGASDADTIDTFEKDSSILFSNGQDELVGQYFNRLFKKYCKDWRFRKVFNIGEHQEHTLVPRNVITDFTVASMNFEYGVHCSERRFLKEIEHCGISTCALKEYVRFGVEEAKKRGLSVDREAIARLGVHSLGYIPNINVTFDSLDLRKVLSLMGRRIDLISVDCQRAKKLTQYYD